MIPWISRLRNPSGHRNHRHGAMAAVRAAEGRSDRGPRRKKRPRPRPPRSRSVEGGGMEAELSRCISHVIIRWCALSKCWMVQVAEMLCKLGEVEKFEKGKNFYKTL